MKRAYTVYATSAANANMQQFTVTTIDDYRTRHIRQLYVGLQASGVAVALYAQGQQYVLVDTTRFANGNYPLEIDFDIPAKLQLVVGIQDLAGAGHTSVPITVYYDVEPGSGP